ncbi:DNA polymerase beta superfamily protein [Acinetobacter baumannii]
MKNHLIMQTLFGSKLYGTDTPSSDLDIKGVFIPHGKDIIMGTGKDHYEMNTGDSSSKNTSADTDLEMFSLQYFIKMAVKGETIALDMIHTPSSCIVDYDNIEPWDFIYQNRSRFYTTDMKAYLGYVKKQAAKYGIKGSRLAALRKVLDWVETLPETKVIDMRENKITRHVTMIDGKFHTDTKIGDFIKDAPIVEEHANVITQDGNTFYRVLTASYQDTLSIKRLKLSLRKQWEGYGERARLAELNQGVDWKSLHHAIRGGLQLKEIYSTGDLIYPLADADMLKRIKAGELQFKEVSEILEDTINEVDKLSQIASKNGMPAKVDTEFWDKFIFDVYSQQVKIDLGWQK